MDLKQIETEIDDYIDMGCFKHPEVAKPYLMDGFNLGFKYASKLSTNSNYATALEVYLEYVREKYGSVRSAPFISWLKKRLKYL